MKKILSFAVCIVMLITTLSGFPFAFAADSNNFNIQSLDYEALFDKAYIINGSWEDAELKEGSTLSFYFRGKEMTEQYDSKRHYNNFNEAYSYYISKNPDILSDLPVFIFAPGTYDYKITVRYSAIILGANAGINPNSDIEWTLGAMADGVPENPNREQETIFTAGLTRTTRGDSNDARWSLALENAEKTAGKKADIKFIIDGVKITGSVGISQYDYSNRLYTDLKLNGNAFEFTPTGNRTTLTALINSGVDNFSGYDADALFSARCNSMNKNDALLKNVRITNLNESAKFLFNKFFRDLTIDGMYFAYSKASLFGTNRTGSSFCGNTDTKTAEYDQNIEIKNSVFYKNPVAHTISLGNASGGAGYTKMTANIHNNFFYDAVCFEKEANYWGIFLVNSAKSDVEYTVNITDNVFHQQTTKLETLFNGNTNYQKSKTILNFNRNKVTGEIDCIYPNMNWKSDSYNYINTSVFYDFSANFHSYSEFNTALRPNWDYPPSTALANGYDYRSAPYYLDYDLNVLSTDFDIKSVSGLGNNVQIIGYDITVTRTDSSGVLTPKITANEGTTVQLFEDALCKNEIHTIDLSRIQKGVTYFIKISKNYLFVIGLLTVTTGKYSDINSKEQIDMSKFELPVLYVNTEGGVPLAKNDKENYVNCEVSISNTKSEFCLPATSAGIRYRGNSTLTAADKKPYRIKFDKKQDLFGMGKAKSWVLLANAFDKTMVRNAIAFAIGEQVGLEYTSKFQFVNLYFNGQYQGMYLLCEQTQTGKTRVNVEEDETGKLDTGYLVEFAGNGDPDEDRSFTINEVPEEDLAKGVTDNWRKDTIKAYLKTPELEFCSDAQVEFISDYVNDVNYAILTQNWESFNELCDVESFAKYFVTSTILNNGDGGYQVYMYKKENGGKLYAGPLWDFDQSSGATIQCGDTYDKWYTGSTHPWFDSFINWPEFMELAKSIYLENYGGIQDILNYYTTDFYPQNAYDFHANDLQWDSVESDYWRITETIKKLKSYSSNFSNLAMWFKNRTAWLDSSYGVVIYPESLTLDKINLIMEKGNEHKLAVTVIPYYSNAQKINWQSSDPSVASVKNGVVTALKDGKCVITASAEGGKASVECSIVVCTDHQYDNACDTNCNVCSKGRVTRHDYGEYEYNYDATSDKNGTKTRTCSICGMKNTIAASGTKLTDSSEKFKDVPENEWYKYYVDFAVTYGIFNGTGSDSFSPLKNLTRAQVVVVFANLSGFDVTANNNVDSGFDDVPANRWYTSAIKWAAENKIVNGYDGKFSPDDEVTREQMCVMLVNYIENYLGKDLSADAPPFADDADISGWAKTAVYKCVNAKLINGVGDNKFSPLSFAIRAQGATIFTNFYKQYLV